MADQEEGLTPAEATPRVLYVSSPPTANGNISGRDATEQPASHSLYQLQINPGNPNQAALVPAPGADGRLANGLSDVLAPAYQINGLPKPGQDFINVEKPTMVELIEGNWKITDMGRLKFSDAPVPALNVFGQQTPQVQEQAALTVEAEGLANEAAITTGATRTEAKADLEEVASRTEQGPDATKAAYADEMRDKAATLPGESAEQQPIAQQQAPAATPAAPGALEAPGIEPVGEVQIQWKQKGDEVAPLLEMRAYLDQLKDAGVAVGAMKMERGEDGKLAGSFGVSYDPESNKLGQLEATLQGLKQVGNGLEVVEKPAQAAARRQEAGYDDDYEPQRSKQVKEAFGVKQWDALSANLTAVPKTALTVPEQVQQSAGEQRVEQLAQQQGKTKEQVLKDGKSIFDIDTSGNPASAFLKNFYAHLNGNPKTRQTLEVDYDKTRQELQGRLLKKAGSAHLDQGDDQVKQAPQGQTTSSPGAPAVSAVPGAAVAPEQSAAKAPTLFQSADVPQKVLASLGLSTADLAQNGQLQKLLSGHKTDLLPMQVAGKEGQEAVKFGGKMVLHREADGTATLKMELPQEKLVIPNEIGGQPFTPEQRKQLETEGTAGLVRGLKDKEGNTYNGYVGVDKEMNTLVVLPENKVTFKDEIAGVKLSPEQSHDLREGKAVHLAQMSRPDGGKPFDGTVQIHAAKAGVEVKPEPYELARKQAPAATQTRDLDSEKKQAPVVTVTETAAPTPKMRGPRL